MRTLDFTPLTRTMIGMDRVSRLLEAAMACEDTNAGYPPYNIEKLGEDRYRITLAVAGFTQNDLNITQKDNSLIIAGKICKQSAGEEACGPDNNKYGQTCTPAGTQYLHKGIAMRSFERKFQLMDHLKVLGASMENGLLHIDLQSEVPEEKKPRTIPIGGAAIEQK